ncbi:MAG: flagellar regulator YcgR PilZN domain-containing protein [Pseudomonadota bacterium]
MARTTGTSAQPKLPDSERISNPVRVARLLERVARQHALLTIDIPGYTDRFTSCIVGVEGPHVLLDELLPASGHEILLAERRLRVTGKLDGIDIRFRTTLDSCDSHDGVVTYRTRLPAQLDYRQRRQDFRAPVPMAHRLRVLLEGRDGVLYEGELHDLSHGGAGVILPDVSSALVAGQTCACAIELPAAGWLYCTVELRYQRTIRGRDRVLLGVSFRALAPQQVRMITQYIIALERELIRKRAAY